MLSSDTSLYSSLVGKCVNMRFLWVITLLELTNFSKMMILEISLIDIEGAGTESTCIRGADVEDSFFI